MSIKRREFLRRSVGTTMAAATWTAARPVAGEPPGEAGPPAIVDTHQHLWDLTKLSLPWLKPGGELTRNFVMKDYLAATRGLNVVKAVYMEVAADAGQLVDEVEYVLEICRRGKSPTCAAVIGGRPAEPGFREYVLRYRGSPYVKGVRHIVHQAEALRDEQLVGGLRLLGELGMSFDLCVPPKLLGAGAALVDRCGDTRFVLDHCGNADPIAFFPAGVKKPRAPQHEADAWRRDIEALARRRNVICKISGIVARMEKGRWSAEQLAPVVNHCLDSFGPDRVVFAGDWPVCTRAATLREWVTALQEIVRDRSAAEQRKLFHDNAVAFYGLG